MAYRVTRRRLLGTGAAVLGGLAVVGGGWPAALADAAQAGPVGLSPSKLGIHLIDRFTPGAQEIVAQGPRVIKILDLGADMLAAARAYKAAHPDGRVVLRIYTTLRYGRGSDPVAAADDFWARGLWPPLSALTAADRALIDYLEGPNEQEAYPAWDSTADAAWFARFWVQLIGHMAAAGFRPCPGSIPVGNPPGSIDDMNARIEAFTPALYAAQANGGAWSYHAYTPIFSQDVGFQNWYALRYRFFYGYLRQAHPDLSLPMILTEGGFDAGGNPVTDGWQAQEDKGQYIPWLMWFDQQLRQDPYILGVTLFQIGTQNWPSFDLEPISDWMAAYLRSQRNDASA